VSENMKPNPLNEPRHGAEAMTTRALVIGGGIAGMQTALDIADAGYEVILVEREPSIGGHMIQLSETFPTLDCSQCIMTPKMVQVSQHPHIRLMTYCEVEKVTGQVGQFDVTIKKKAAYLDRERCTGCGLCSEKCPTKVPSEFDLGLGKRKAIYVPFPQAVPPKPVIDAENCRFLKNGKCGVCKKVCEVEAIDFEQTDTFIEERVGAIVVATGYDLRPKEDVAEYGYGQYPDVISGLEFERLNSASGPTNGEIRRPSDGKVPKEVVFIQCVGSRDQEKGVPYCSRICCMYTAKHAMLYKHKVHDGQAYVFYMDIRADGKGYEEFVQRAVEEDDTLYLRGRVSRVFRHNGKIVVWGADTLARKKIEISADMVVLATAIVPTKGVGDLSRKLNIVTDEYGFCSEAHSKLHPVESASPGIFLAGCAQSPKDIPDCVSHAGCAASKVTGLFSSFEAGGYVTGFVPQSSAVNARKA
jgi:heterodisulfide reductase subunit A